MRIRRNYDNGERCSNGCGRCASYVVVGGIGSDARAPLCTECLDVLGKNIIKSLSISIITTEERAIIEADIVDWPPKARRKMRATLDAQVPNEANDALPDVLELPTKVTSTRVPDDKGGLGSELWRQVCGALEPFLAQTRVDYEGHDYLRVEPDPQPGDEDNHILRMKILFDWDKAPPYARKSWERLICERQENCEHTHLDIAEKAVDESENRQTWAERGAMNATEWNALISDWRQRAGEAEAKLRKVTEERDAMTACFHDMTAMRDKALRELGTWPHQRPSDDAVDDAQSLVDASAEQGAGERQMRRMGLRLARSILAWAKDDAERQKAVYTEYPLDKGYLRVTKTTPDGETTLVVHDGPNEVVERDAHECRDFWHRTAHSVGSTCPSCNGELWAFDPLGNVEPPDTAPVSKAAWAWWQKTGADRFPSHKTWGLAGYVACAAFKAGSDWMARELE